MKVWVLTYEDGFTEVWHAVGVFATKNAAEAARDRYVKSPPTTPGKYGWTLSDPDCWYIQKHRVR